MCVRVCVHVFVYSETFSRFFILFPFFIITTYIAINFTKID